MFYLMKKDLSVLNDSVIEHPLVCLEASEDVLDLHKAVEKLVMAGNSPEIFMIVEDKPFKTLVVVTYG